MLHCVTGCTTGEENQGVGVQGSPAVPPLRIEYRLEDGREGAGQGQGLQGVHSLPSPDYTRAVGHSRASLVTGCTVLCIA